MVGGYLPRRVRYGRSGTLVRQTAWVGEMTRHDPQRMQIFLSREATAAVREAIRSMGRSGNCKELVDAAVVAYCIDMVARRTALIREGK